MKMLVTCLVDRNASRDKFIYDGQEMPVELRQKHLLWTRKASGTVANICMMEKNCL